MRKRKLDEATRLTEKQLEGLRNRKWDEKDLQKEAAKAVAYIVRHHTCCPPTDQLGVVLGGIKDLTKIILDYLPILDEDALEESIYLMSQYLWLYGNEKLHRCFRVQLLHKTPPVIQTYLENCLLNDPSYFLMVQNGCNRSRCFVPQNCTCQKPLRRLPVSLQAEHYYRNLTEKKRQRRLLYR
jgi:hypothetical protein